MNSQTASNATTTTSCWLDVKSLKLLFIFATITPLIVIISHNQNVNEMSTTMSLSDALIACLIALPGVAVFYLLTVLVSVLV